MDQLTLSLGVSHAKTSASQEKGQDSQESGQASGLNIAASSKKRGRSGSSQKTSQPFDLGDWTRCSGHSLRSGMMRNGIVYPLQPLALLTAGTASGSLPTPTTSDYKGSVGPEKILQRISHPRGVRLEEHLKRGLLLPTPTAGNNHSAGRLDEWGGANSFRGTDIGKLHLNPSFVEEMMGFPVGWTALSNSETP